VTEAPCSNHGCPACGRGVSLHLPCDALYPALQVSLCLLWAPFWFNPQTFSMSRTKVRPPCQRATLLRRRNGFGCTGLCHVGSILWLPPSTLSSDGLQEDFDKWRLWMADVQDPDTKSTWFSWNKVRALQ
jgi:hypothetical protein